MTMLQFISFVLLWAVLIAEGAALYLLYRHVAIAYAPQKGLAVGTQAPHLRARNAEGRKVSLAELLTADYNLLVFGSPACTNCRTLLLDRGVRQLLIAQSIGGYFLNYADELTSAAIASLGSSPSLEIFSIEKNILEDYAVNATPFAYVVTRAGVIGARGHIGGPHDIEELCEYAMKRDHPVESVQAQAPRTASESLR